MIMSEQDIKKIILSMARELIRSSMFTNKLIRAEGKLNEPLVVSHPAGGVYSWIVAVTIKEKIAGYLQFSDKPELMRYSSFQRDEERIEDCPPANSWLDPKSIKAKASDVAKPNEILDLPILTYDQFPDRLAWMVVARQKNGSTRRIIVAGDNAYEQVDLNGSIGGPVTGGSGRGQ